MEYITPNLSFNNHPEIPGNKKDIEFIEQGGWLVNSEVRYRIESRNGRWFVTMVFISTDNPYKLICRDIDSYNSLQKAETYAKIFQRGIRKDARGTQKSNLNAFDICNN